MKHKFFTIPIFNSEPAESDLNQFCGRHRIVDIDKHYDAGNSAWVFCVTWLSVEGALTPASKSSIDIKKPKVDYKEILSSEAFEQFCQLRNIRTIVAEREGIAVYNIFTNEQLCAMLEQKITNKAELLKLEGVGQTRAEKYSEPFFQKIKQLITDETSLS